MQELEARLAAKMKRSLDGDPVAYRELLEEVRDVLVGYFSRHCKRYGIRDEAFGDDLIQETLIAVHEKRLTFDVTQPFTPWMYAIARYKLIDLVRRRKNLRLENDIETIDELAAVLSDDAQSAGQDIERLLADLPEKQRRAVELTKLEGLSVAEAAKKTGMSVAAVKVTVHRAIKSLKKKLENEKR